MSFLPTTITLSIQNLSLGLISFITAYTGHMLKVEFSLRLIPSVFKVSLIFFDSIRINSIIVLEI
jgi:hypothetical protein